MLALLFLWRRGYSVGVNLRRGQYVAKAFPQEWVISLPYLEASHLSMETAVETLAQRAGWKREDPT